MLLEYFIRGLISTDLFWKCCKDVDCPDFVKGAKFLETPFLFAFQGGLCSVYLLISHQQRLIRANKSHVRRFVDQCLLCYLELRSCIVQQNARKKIVHWKIPRKRIENSSGNISNIIPHLLDYLFSFYF
jgi:hypothetical protein